MYESGADAFITDIGKHCDDFADTAAAIEQLDAIIMTDSSVAHLAASLGKPVINLLNRVPYWLYTLEKDRCPWYPSMQFIYRDEVQDWREDVVQTLRHSGASQNLDVAPLSHSGEGRNLETTARHPMCSEVSIPIFVINLKRRTDRWQQFQQWNESANSNVERLDAIDGQQLNTETLQQLVTQKLLHPDAINAKPAEISCALSHRNAWLKAIELNRPILVLEDDVVLRNDVKQQLASLMKQLPTGWDMVLLGYNLDSILDTQITQGLHSITRYMALDRTTNTWQRPTSLSHSIESFKTETTQPSLAKLNNAFGACAYFISPMAAKKLLISLFPIQPQDVQIPALGKTLYSLAIDIQLNRIYRATKSYVVTPPLVLAVNDKTVSDVQS